MSFLRSFILGVLGVASLVAAPAAEIPRLEKRGAATQLVVDGRPFLVLGGELHNSTASSLEYTRPLLPQLAALNLNTVLATVSWDLVEPAEGRYDFALVDGLLAEARRNHLRLILLWFGSWKNGLSHYAPDWVKADTKRFPRARLRTGTTEVLSTLAPANWEADARAFAALMKHLRTADETQRTVIMVQVQNEVGLLGDSRDRSPIADTGFAAPVPQELLAHLTRNRDALLPEFRALWEAAGARTSGTWAEVFGSGPRGDEVFMGWNYARYVSRVAAAGKREYALPMFVNAWIVQPEDKVPGDYPGGGPQGHMLDVWRAGVATEAGRGGVMPIDLFAPDIYLPKFTEVCAEFTRSGNPLFVPESFGGARGVVNAFVAIGRFHGIGYSPFGIDGRDLGLPEVSPLQAGYGVLRQMTPLILDAQTRGAITAVALTRETNSETITLGDFALTVALRTNRRAPTEQPASGVALVVQTGADEFFVAGADVQVTFATNPPGQHVVGLATVEEGAFADGRWMPRRTLNGDEIMISYRMTELAAGKQTGTGLRFQSSTPSIQRVQLYRYD